MTDMRTVFFYFSLWILATEFATAQHGNSRALRQSYACEGLNLNISCNNPGENSQRIRVVRANYGRFSIAVCNPDGVSSWSTKCMSHTSTQVLNERCNDKPSCSVEVDDKTFGDDPCPDTQKYLEVHYECTSDTTTGPPVLPTQASPALFQSRVFAVTTPTTVQTTVASTTATSTSTTTTTSTTSVEPEEVATVPTTQKKPGKSSKPKAVIEVIQLNPDTAEQLPMKASQQATEYCPPITRQNIVWPKTPKGATAFEVCPQANTKGYAEWSCNDSSPPQWSGVPDFSGCTSPWIDDIRKKAASDIPPEKVAEEFAQLTARNQLISGGDISSTVDLIENIVQRGKGAAARMLEGAQQGPDPGIQKLGESMLKAGSNVLANKHNSSWGDLPEDIRSEKATLLIKSMESTAFMLADNVAVGTILTSADKNIVMGAGKLQTRQLAESYKFPSSDASGSANSIEFSAATLQQYSEEDIVRVIFLSYNNIGDYLNAAGKTADSSFYAPPQGFVVNSKVVSAAINGRRQKTELQEPVMIAFEHIYPKGRGKPVCAYWDYRGKGQDFKAFWSTKGCWVVDSSDERTICSCNHLTNFAVLMDVTGTVATSSHNAPLTQITYIGCSISIVCLVITLITFFSFRSLQSERTTIHKNLVFCLLVAEIFFLAGINQTQLPVGCQIFSAIMHYFFLAAFAWSLFEGINIWLLLVEVFETVKPRRMWYYLCGYVGPLIIVAICLGIDWKSYATPDYCWLRADNYFILSFVVPVGIIVVANIVFLSVALYYMCRNVGLQSALHARDVDTWKNVKKWISGALALVFIMSITWIFGFVYLGNTNTIIFAYVFTLLNSFQGVFIFVLICLRNDKVKVALRQFFVNQTERLTGSFCTRSSTADFSDSGTHSGRQGFYQCAPPLDKEQQYIASFAPCWYGTRPTDTSRRNTTTSTLPPHSPAPVPQCTCEHDFPEKSSTRSSNRDSGHESVSCPSAESPPMQPIHIHQRTLYPPSAARKHASQVLKSEYPATAARIAARNAKFLYGERGLYCGNDEHIYAEIEQQHMEEEVCPYSESDESNTSVYQINGSEASTDDDHLPVAIGLAVADLEGRKVPVHHPSTCSNGSEHKPLINSLSRFPGDLSRPVDVRSAFRSLSNPHSHAKLRNSANMRKPHICHSTDNYPYVNTGPRMQSVHVPIDPNCSLGNYNAFGLTATRDGSQMIRRLPMMPKIPDQPPSYSEC